MKQKNFLNEDIKSRVETIQEPLTKYKIQTILVEKEVIDQLPLELRTK